MSRLITGLQPVREAIRVHGAKLERILVHDKGGPQIEAVARFATDRGVLKVDRVTMSELDRASKGARHQGAIAIAPDLTIVGIDELISSFDVNAKEAHVVIALDEIEDPQNFGAVIRSAVALGATAIVWPENHAAPLSPATFRASAGAVEHARLCRVGSLPSALEQLHSQSAARIIGLDAHGPLDIRTIESPKAGSVIVLVVGAEGKGLRRVVKRSCTELARLPMSGTIDSLNASVAAALALFAIINNSSTSPPRD